MMECRELSKSYGFNKRALDGVSLTFGPGEIVGLFGENGAGKTTLLKCLLGLLSYKGTVTLDGEPITGKNIHRLSFATCEHSFFPGLTASDHRQFYETHFPTSVGSGSGPSWSFSSCPPDAAFSISPPDRKTSLR